MGKDGASPGVDTRSSATKSPAQASFPKSVRLRKRREFLAVQRGGRRFHAEHFLAVVRLRGEALPTTIDPAHDPRPGRVGVTVTKKVGHAVIRNRIKRMVREYVRTSPWLGIPMDTVFIAKYSAAGLTSQRDVAQDLSTMFEKVARFASSARPRRDPRTGGSGNERGRASC